MMRFGILKVFVVSAIVPVAAQKSMIGQYIASTASDSQLIAQSTHAAVVRENSFAMPLISDAEIRLRKSDYFGRDSTGRDSILDNIFGLRYTLRLRPRGVGETKAIRAYYRVQEAAEEHKSDYLFNKTLVDRYIDVIDLLERQMTLATSQDLITLYEDRIRVMDQLKNSADFDLNELIRAEKDLSKLTVQHLEEAQETEIMCYAVGLVLGDTSFSGFDTSGLISVAAIKNIVDSTKFTLNEDNYTLRNIEGQFELAETRFELEKAQNRQIVSYFEFSYDHPGMLDELHKRERGRYYDSRGAFILDLGIKLPWLSINRQDFARRQIDFMRDREEYDQLRRDLAKKMRKDESDIRALIKQYEFLTARENEVDAEASLKKYLQMSGVDPLVLLSIKENLIKNNMEKASIYYSILRNFIYVIDVTGRMSSRPLCNCLSLRREVLEP